MANPQVPVHGETIESSWGADVVSRVVPVYADAATRDSQLPSPEDGRLAFTADDDLLWVFHAGQWQWVLSNASTYLGWKLTVSDTRFTVSDGPNDRFRITDDGWRFYTTAGATQMHYIDTDNTIAFRDAGRGIDRLTVDFTGQTVRVESHLDIRHPPTTTVAADVHMQALGSSPVTFRLRQSTSSRAAKTDQQRLTSSGTVIDALEPVTFRSQLPDDPHDPMAGFIAEDVASAFPPASAGDTNYDVRAIAAVLVAEVQDLRRRVAVLEGKT